MTVQLSRYWGQGFPQNYRPYWLHPLVRPAARFMVPKFIAKDMNNLARMAESAPAAGEGS